MSQVPYYFPKAPLGRRMFNAEMVDGMVHDGLWEIFNNYHMGITSENIAEKYKISREEQDRFSLVSNQRALAAIKDGTFKQEIVPVEIKDRKAVKIFDTTSIPGDTTMEQLGKCPLSSEDGSVTGG